jgi:three-Cys-motif partner protein
MLRTFPRLTVLEGYAGPGIYNGGEDGSPVIALDALIQHSELLVRGKAVRFVFIEDRQDRFRRLREVIDQRFPRLPRGITLDYHHGSCEDTWETALNQSNAWGQPIFANLDPFGPGVPFALVQRLGANRSSEVLVTFASDWLRRFWSLEEIGDGDMQFGSKAWRKVGELDDPEKKELFLVETYRETLGRAGFNLTAPFKLSDEGGHSFYLICGTSHRRGLERMKEAMWKIDPVGGVQFRDPRDPNQGVLDLGIPDPDISPLVRIFNAKLASNLNASHTVEELKDFALFNTGFRPPHATKAIQQMIERGDAMRSPAKGQLTKKVRITQLR